MDVNLSLVLFSSHIVGSSDPSYDGIYALNLNKAYRPVNSTFSLAQV